MTTDLTMLVIERENVDLKTALDIVYRSNTYSKLCDPRTHLMFQNPGYVYCYLKEELNSAM